MPDLVDLFPGYQSKWIDTSSGRIFVRVGGNGPPLLLLHGFSSTHVMWLQVAPQLADKFTLIIADLPGYGWSDVPESDKDHTPYTKRAMASSMVEAMEQLGHVHFALAGHDPDAGIVGRRRHRQRSGNAARHLEAMGHECFGIAGRFRSLPDRRESRRDREAVAGVFYRRALKNSRSSAAASLSPTAE